MGRASPFPLAFGSLCPLYTDGTPAANLGLRKVVGLMGLRDLGVAA